MFDVCRWMCGAKTTHHTLQGVVRPGAPVVVYSADLSSEPWWPAGRTAMGSYSDSPTYKHQHLAPDCSLSAMLYLFPATCFPPTLCHPPVHPPTHLIIWAWSSPTPSAICQPQISPCGLMNRVARPLEAASSARVGSVTRMAPDWGGAGGKAGPGQRYVDEVRPLIATSACRLGRTAMCVAHPCVGSSRAGLCSRPSWLTVGAEQATNSLPCTLETVCSGWGLAATALPAQLHPLRDCHCPHLKERVRV